jgi:hypothetical protein
LIGCGSYIGYLAIGEIIKMASEIPLSHQTPIETMVYSASSKTVIIFNINILLRLVKLLINFMPDNYVL